jgi:hypothetical protein
MGERDTRLQATEKLEGKGEDAVENRDCSTVKSGSGRTALDGQRASRT